MTGFAYVRPGVLLLYYLNLRLLSRFLLKWRKPIKHKYWANKK